MVLFIATASSYLNKKAIKSALKCMIIGSIIGVSQYDLSISSIKKILLMRIGIKIKRAIRGSKKFFFTLNGTIGRCSCKLSSSDLMYKRLLRAVARAYATNSPKASRGYDVELVYIPNKLHFYGTADDKSKCYHADKY